MKKLKKLKLYSFEDYPVVLNEYEMQAIMAGSGTWDCMFNTFIYTYQQQYGITLDRDTLVQQYKDKTGHDPQAAGGASIGYFMSFINYYGFQGSQNTSGSVNDWSSSQWAAFGLDSSSSILHFAVPTSAYRDSNGDIWIVCDDPTAGEERHYRYSDMKGTFDLSPFYIDSSISVSYGSYGSYDTSYGSTYYA